MLRGVGRDVLEFQPVGRRIDELRALDQSSWLGQPRSGTGRLTLRESMALDPKRRLHLVQCGSRQVVLLTGGAQDLVVGWIEPER